MGDRSLYLGLISGTSADAIDAALVAFDGTTPRCLATAATPYAPALQARILDLALGRVGADFDRCGALDVEIGEAFAAAAESLIRASGVDRNRIRAVGSHGQTLWHRPDASPPFSVQLGDPNVIAERLRLRTVADFRRRDIAAGGQGAPLAPAFHDAFLASPTEARAVLNLGGIANLTLLVPGEPVRGFDTGPASALMDAWCQTHTGATFDRDGRWAAQGRVLDGLLARLAADPYFPRPAPKSTGRETFQLQWLREHLEGSEDSADVQATLLALTAQTVASALRRECAGARRVIACGGGVHNPQLMAALRLALAPVRLETSDLYGLDPDYVEAMLFAWLARETLEGRPGNRPEVTGARGARVLGAIYPG
ncbi:MAG: anhydro-N-acetylmuramic acid kinase [Xanthomonadales bacterium]|nr:anhydro-N-acetylmuramic acid kinase [Xanthomonadales bacterium]